MNTLTNPQWRNVRLGDIGQSLIGLTYSPSNVKRSGTLVLRSSNIQDGELAFDDNVYVDCAIPEKIRTRENDILICVRNGSRRLIGKSAILDRRVSGQTFGAFMAVYRSDLNPFLRYFFQSDDFKRQIDEHLGATINQITNGSLNGFVVTLPSESEQQAITERLQDVDRLIATLKRLISKKHAIKQGMMQELLSGKTRLPGFHSPWVTYSFGHLLSYEQPGPYLVGSAEYSQSGIPVLTAGKTFVLGYTRENDGIYAELPVIIFDDFTTATQYVDFPFKAKSSAMKILTAMPGVDIRWVFEKMQNVKFNAVDHKRRWITEYSKIEIPTPSLEEQRAIAEVIRDADDEIRTLQSRLESARNIKQGIMQELLSGRTRLPVEEVSS